MYRRKDYQIVVDTSHKENLAIMRCVYLQNKYEKNQNIVAFSGGKDSVVTYMMAVKSGIDFVPIYSKTSVDPPEVINYIRHAFNPWAVSKGYPKVIINPYNKFSKRRAHGRVENRDITMWSLLSNRCIPPTRLTRYCCDELKERTGNDFDTIYVGVRWEESRSRSSHKTTELWKNKIMVRPIIDWNETEVWSYIVGNNIPYCELYDKGWDRVGCIGCPLSSKNQVRELEAYPKFKENYIRAFDRMIEYRKYHYEECKSEEVGGDWKTGLDIYSWWTGKTNNNSRKKFEEQILNGQTTFYDGDYEINPSGCSMFED